MVDLPLFFQQLDAAQELAIQKVRIGKVVHRLSEVDVVGLTAFQQREHFVGEKDCIRVPLILDGTMHGETELLDLRGLIYCFLGAKTSLNERGHFKFKFR